jgi:hypothetical protein
VLLVVVASALNGLKSGSSAARVLSAGFDLGSPATLGVSFSPSLSSEESPGELPQFPLLAESNIEGEPLMPPANEKPSNSGLSRNFAIASGLILA